MCVSVCLQRTDMSTWPSGPREIWVTGFLKLGERRQEPLRTDVKREQFVLTGTWLAGKPSTSLHRGRCCLWETRAHLPQWNTAFTSRLSDKNKSGFRLRAYEIKAVHITFLRGRPVRYCFTTFHCISSFKSTANKQHPPSLVAGSDGNRGPDLPTRLQCSLHLLAKKFIQTHPEILQCRTDADITNKLQKIKLWNHLKLKSKLKAMVGFGFDSSNSIASSLFLVDWTEYATEVRNK